MSYPKTLFARTGLTIAILVFLLFSGSVIFYYILQPVARQASEDLAALIVLSAQTWVELPPETRSDFEDELQSQHGLTLSHTNTPLTTPTIKSPFLHCLEDALSHRQGSDIFIMHDSADSNWLWVDIPIADYSLRIGFTHNRIRARPPAAMLALILGASIITLLTSLLLVRRLTHPLARLAKETSRFGRGERPDPLPEDGPEEFALLARNFNHMTGQVQQLLTNRTTLLGGISHDLRTPIARLQLAMEFINHEQDPKLLEGMHHDLAEMNHLIAAHEHQGGTVKWEKPPPCMLQTNPTALNRVLANLLENARRYGENKPIRIELECGINTVTISLLDRGPGIPEDQFERVFQPFYRLDSSRNQTTGGSGLGLAIVKQLCDIYGWQVQLQPRSGGGLIAQLTVLRNRHSITMD